MAAGQGGKTKFAKGKSGNPNGPPKKEFTLRAFYEEFYEAKDPEEKKSRIQVVLEKQYKQVKEHNDTSMIKHIVDQVYGKAKETVDANMNQPITVMIKQYKEKGE